MQLEAMVNGAEDDILTDKFDSYITVDVGLVILKLFVPPKYYGSYLVFKASGEPVGVLNELGASLVHEAKGVKIAALIFDQDGKVNSEKLDGLLYLLEQNILVPGSDQNEVHWITPDKLDGTRHKGKAAELFINFFYNYFGGVFYEGSTLIDSDKEFLSIVEKYFPQNSGYTCLDAGAGSGFYSAALARKGNTVYACDISQTRLDACSQQLYDPGKVEVILCNLEDIPLPDQCIDFAMCNFVLEHVADPFLVIDQIIRLLKPGGYFLFSVPSFNIRDTLSAWLHGEVPSLNFEHLRSYGLFPKTHPWCEPTMNTIDYLNKHGVNTEVIEGVNILTGLWEPWSYALNMIASQMGKAFSTSWPWNCFGQQTIFLGKKQNYNNELQR